MFNRLRTVVAVAMLTVATYAASASMAAEHPDTYVVRKGDTLWDIAGRFLGKPWLWPEIWQANPQVQNPHLIYPGDVLSLAYLDRVARATVKPGPRQDAPIDAIPLSEVEPFLKNLRVADSIDGLPYVVGVEDNQLRATAGQLVYATGLSAPQTGQRYAVVRPTVRYALPRLSDDLNAEGRSTPGTGNLWRTFVPPDTKRRETLGYELAQVNVGTVTRVSADDSQATTLLLQDSAREVRAGDRLIAVQAQPYDLQFVPHPPSAQALEAGLRVLAVADAFSVAGPRDVIAISGGSREGIDNGTVVSLWRHGTRVNDRVQRPNTSRADDGFSGSRGTVALPDEYAAHAMVFRTFDKVSYALVMDGIKPTRIGYDVKHPDAR
ncbi:LysM peptidoglycan-binding domain-containing protein [Xanthomonas cerealis pv. cerealis]|uniref:LysM peptidoglycan-binding domain-containing protein n=1 Tax=Xanthomonas cerealis TaxID=3390025 RepID=UPI001F1ADFF7|nr:LysM peptidoglycan-binding domain-containing protein [Xanthomonas translucens]UKE69956.1 LysM peptidoglycan-binding domain-containing protein [Xanthomonas translucens pv. pistacia]